MVEFEFEKYHKIKRSGDDENKDIFTSPEDEIIIEEKLDGANFRFHINKNGKVIFGSRNQQLTSNEGEDTNITKNFKRCVEFVRESLRGVSKEYLKDLIGLIFYGETMIKHTMSYNWDIIPSFLGFDIKSNTGYLDYDLKKAIFNNLGLEIVPLVWRGKVNELSSFLGNDEGKIVDNHIGITKYPPISNPKTLCEGWAIKNYNKQIFMKVVRDKFKEANSATFGGNPKYNKVDDTINSVLVFKFCTNARIEKMILKLQDEGHKLEMKLMGTLPKRVYADVVEEEWKYIVYSKKKVDFSALNKMMTKRCLAVLKQTIENNVIINKGEI